MTGAAESYAYHAERVAEGRPLAFVFHGTGGTENQFVPLMRELLPGAAIVAPRGDVSEHGALRFFRRKAEGLYDMADLEKRTVAMIGFLGASLAYFNRGRHVQNAALALLLPVCLYLLFRVWLNAALPRGILPL